MELSADDHVMKQSNIDIRSAYSNSLLSLSATRSGLLNPIAFGEISVRMRIKNVLKYKNPAFFISIVSAIVVITASVLLLGSAASSNAEAGIDITLPNQADSDSVLTVYIDEAENYSGNDTGAFAYQILTIPNVNSVAFVSREQALEEFLRLAGDTYLYEGIDASCFRDRYLVYITDTALVEQIISDLLATQGVIKVSIGFRIDDSEINALRQAVYAAQPTPERNANSSLPDGNESEELSG